MNPKDETNLFHLFETNHKAEQERYMNALVQAKNNELRERLL